MQAAAIILTLVALYAAAYSFCRAAADAEAQADRYRTRLSRTRKLAKVYPMPSRTSSVGIEVARGR